MPVVLFCLQMSVQFVFKYFGLLMRCMYLITPPDSPSIIAFTQFLNMKVIMSVFTMMVCLITISLYDSLWVGYWCLFLGDIGVGISLWLGYWCLFSGVIGVGFGIFGAFSQHDFCEDGGVILFGEITLGGVEVLFFYGKGMRSGVFFHRMHPGIVLKCWKFG